jgi:outer membrane protein assembly factor BamB
VALDRFTGELKWSCRGKGNRSAYATPLLLNLPAGKLLVTHTASNILGIDASNGNLLWSQNHPNEYSVHPNTPLYHDGALFCFSGYGRGSVMIELDEQGNKVGTKWTEKSLDSRMGGAVLIDGYLYGSGDYDRSWKCLDWETGKQMHESTSIGNGVVISADGLLFCYSQRGELALVQASPSEFNVTGKTRVSLGSGQHWAHPVIHEGRLYVRHGSVLMAYRIK